MEAAVYLIWLGILLAPLAGVAAFRAIRTRSSALKKMGIVVSVGMICCIAIATKVGINFVSVISNVWSLLIAYAAYCFLAASCWQFERRIIRYPLGILTSLPIIFGYFTGTVGALGLLFIAGDYTSPPLETRTIDSRLLCTKTRWGSAISDEGYTIHIYQSWRYLPFLHREIARQSFDETEEATNWMNQSAQATPPTCESVAKSMGR